jgi:hypothetical protein
MQGVLGVLNSSVVAIRVSAHIFTTLTAEAETSPLAQGIILLVFIGALLYLVRKLYSFVKALQDIQYVRHPIDAVLLRSILDAVLSKVSYGSNVLFTEKHQCECL